jgi:hypothetical protein
VSPELLHWLRDARLDADPEIITPETFDHVDDSVFNDQNDSEKGDPGPAR